MSEFRLKISRRKTGYFLVSEVYNETWGPFEDREEAREFRTFIELHE
jgi:hypothetical protein